MVIKLPKYGGINGYGFKKKLYFNNNHDVDFGFHVPGNTVLL